MREYLSHWAQVAGLQNLQHSRWGSGLCLLWTSMLHPRPPALLSPWRSSPGDPTDQPPKSLALTHGGQSVSKPDLNDLFGSIPESICSLEFTVWGVPGHPWLNTCRRDLAPFLLRVGFLSSLPGAISHPADCLRWDWTHCPRFFPHRNPYAKPRSWNCETPLFTASLITRLALPGARRSICSGPRDLILWWLQYGPKVLPPTSSICSSFKCQKNSTKMHIVLLPLKPSMAPLVLRLKSKLLCMPPVFPTFLPFNPSSC